MFDVRIFTKDTDRTLQDFRQKKIIHGQERTQITKLDNQEREFFEIMLSLGN